MKRRTSTATVMVYTFGVGGRLIESEDLVASTMGAAHRYGNALTEIERKRREAIRAAQHGLDSLAEHQSRVKEAREHVDALYANLASHKQDQRTRRVSSEMRQKIAEAKEVLKLANSHLKQAKADAAEELKPLYQACEDRASEALRKARGESGVYHPTYQLVEARAKASRNALSKKLSPDDDPRFRAFPRPYGARIPGLAEGRIGVVTGGKRVTVEEAFSGENDWLRMGRISPDAYYLPRGERQRSTRTRVSFRVGSNPDRTPIWATFSDVIIHRQLPPDGVITMAWFKLRSLGDRKSDQKWDLQLTIEAPSTDQTINRQHPRAAFVAAINVGWRALDACRRVAYVVDSDGAEQEVTYAATARGRARMDGGDRFAHADSIRAIRGRAFDKARDSLAAFVRTLEGYPDWIADRAPFVHQWRSSSRLASLVREWASNRFHGDAEMYQALVKWMHQDAHLYQWETRERSRAEGARKNYYRLIAKALCERYGVLVLGEMDLAKLARRKAPEDSEDDQTTAQRKGRARTAPSEFLAAINLFARKTGTLVEKCDASYITQKCHCCELVEAWDARSDLHHQCSGCGSLWDQDANACRNLLSRYRERSDEVQVAGGARILKNPCENVGMHDTEG